MSDSRQRAPISLRHSTHSVFEDSPNCRKKRRRTKRRPRQSNNSKATTLIIHFFYISTTCNDNRADRGTLVRNLFWCGNTRTHTLRQTKKGSLQQDLMKL